MNDLPELSGPEGGPASGGAAKQLIVFVHGYGADGNDLIGLAPHYAQVVPDTAFISPNAPYPCEMAPFGRQWFSIQNEDPATRLEEIRHAAGVIDRFIDEQLALHGLTPDRLVLGGAGHRRLRAAVAVGPAVRHDGPAQGADRHRRCRRRAGAGQRAAPGP